MNDTLIYFLEQFSTSRIGPIENMAAKNHNAYSFTKILGFRFLAPEFLKNNLTEDL